MEPLLTIAIPSYNVDWCLGRNLGSLDDPRLAGRVEALVVDDGSTDGTARLARSFVERGPATFRLLSKPNGGHGSAINAALELARGRYFRVVDADDWVQADALAQELDLLEDSRSDLVVDVKREVNAATGQEVVFPLPPEVVPGQVVAFDSVCDRGEVGFRMMIHTLTARTALLRESGLHLLEGTFYEDFEYVVKATLPARDALFLDLQVYNYQVGSQTQSVADASYVRRYADHERVTLAICDLWRDRSASLSPQRASYLFRRAQLIINTHYKIALVFDQDRQRGMERARDFRELLKRDYHDLYRATHDRYLATVGLHLLGARSQDQLDALLGRRNRKVDVS